MAKQRDSDVKKLGIGGLLTEFGAIDDSPKSVKEIQVITDLMDQYLYGYVYWTYKSYHDITTANTKGSEDYYWGDGLLQESKVKALTRTYARKICGQIQKMRFNVDTKDFELDYTAFANCSQTEVFASMDYYYGNGIEVIVNPNLNYTINENIITIHHSSAVHAGEHITVLLKAK